MKNLTIVIVLVVTIVVLLVVFLRKLNKLKRLNLLLRKDFKSIEFESIVEYKAFVKIHRQLEKYLERLKNEFDLKNLQREEIKSIIDAMTIETNNMDVILNDEPHIQVEKRNLKNDIQSIFDDFYSDIGNFHLQPEFSGEVNLEFIYDRRLILALKMLFTEMLNTSKVNSDSRFIVSSNKKIRSLYKISITLESYLEWNDEKQNNIFEFLNIETISPVINDCKIDPTFLIIRQNLLHAAKSISCKNQNGKTIITIEVELKKGIQKKQNYKALIVDHDTYRANLTKKILKEIKLESNIVSSGEEGVEEVSRNYDKYDMIFTNNVMPNMDGIDMRNELIEMEGFNTPMVIQSIDEDKDDYFLNVHGFDGYIVKPITKQKAEEVIKKLIKD